VRILFLSRWFPYPADNGAKIRISNLVQRLASRHPVDLISFTSEPLSEEQLGAARRYCQRVICALYRPFQPRRLKALTGFLAPQPRSVIDTFSAEMQAHVEKARSRNTYDLVIASQIDMAPYALTWPGIPKLLEEVELTVLYEDFVRQRNPLKRLRKRLMWWKTSRYVAGILNRFDGCTVVSEPERQHVLQVVPGYAPVKVVPNGIDPASYTGKYGLPEADTLVYSGSLTYFANWDAVDFFLRNVYPLVRAERPQVKLLVTGKLDGAPIDRLPHCDGVVFTGFLDDVRPTIAQSWTSIVPLRVGGGTRLKILEALALGTPVVSTRKGAEGLELVPEREILIADEPADIASAIVRILGDPHLRDTLSRNGQQAVTVKYNWQTIGQDLSAFVEAIADRGSKSA
jgi:glycosyltransferase involved in cell wall biosynthesis